VYDAAAFLKKWVRDLPQPLLNPAVVNRVLDKDNPDSVRSVLQGLSEPARKTFAYLCGVIYSVLSQANVNQMNFSNLSFCFLDSITQSSKDLQTPFPFRYFFSNAMLLINPDRTDFVLDNPIPAALAVRFEAGDAPVPIITESAAREQVKRADLV
jgi:hypothetical protein